MKLATSLFYFLQLFLICVIFASDFQDCPPNREEESREVYVATCDSRSGWKEFIALKNWNVTGIELRKQGIFMVNVCQGLNWGRHGFLTKPMMYLKFIETLPKVSSKGGRVYVILMDSDTIWSANHVSQIWHSFDCARNQKDVLISTEMSCWVGRYCKEPDIVKWYNNSAQIVPSYSPFLNSGVIMGLASKVSDMLSFVVQNNQSYFTTYTKHKFDDQYAIADYAIRIAPEDCALDYRQQFAASCSVHTVGEEPDQGWPFVCKSRQNQMYYSCKDFTKRVGRHGHFRVDEESCLGYRHVDQFTPEAEELRSLAPRPVIWHGNGAGKNQFLGISHSSFKCFLRKYNWTEQDHFDTFG